MKKKRRDPPPLRTRSSMPAPAAVLLAVLVWILYLPCGGAADYVYHTSFEEGTSKPKGWIPPGKKDEWVWEKVGHTGNRCISLIGYNDEDGHAVWQSDPIPVDPGRVYRLTFWYKMEHEKKARGCGMGPAHVRIAFPFSADWREGEIFFWTPPHMKKTRLSFSIYHIKGKAYLDDVRLETMGVAYSQQGGLALSEHEQIEKGTYVFDWHFNTRTTNIVPVVTKIDCNYMDKRIRFASGEEVVFKFDLGQFEQLSGKVASRLSYYIDGEAIWLASKDGKTWIELGRMSDKKNIKNLGKNYDFTVPASLYPVKTLFLKLASTGALQIDRVRYEAKLSGSPPDMKGSTTFFKGHLVTVDNGALRLLFDQSLPRLVSIRSNGRPIGDVRCRLAQFEKEGIGYKGTGIESSSATGIKAVEVKKNTPTKCVVVVTAERSASEPCKREFEAKYEITAIAGQRWFTSRLLSIKNTDTVPYTVKGYNYLLTPAADPARPVAFPTVAMWLSKGPTLGCLMDQTEPFTLGLRKAADGPHGDVTRRIDTRIDPGMTVQKDDPALAIFVVPANDLKAAYRQAQDVRSALRKPVGRIAVGAITCEESEEQK
ncbi:MAG: hypothetical protein GXP25_24780 [Planctomycetes bacterium]|nr:hypothetical protein [Planctomycetota bacterium]